MANSLGLRAPHSCAFRWAARVAAIVMFLFWLTFAIAEGLPPLWEQPLSVQLMFAGWATTFAGYLLGWRWQLVGGVVALAGVAAMYAVEIYFSGQLPGIAFALFAVPGALYLLAALVSHLDGGGCRVPPA